MMLRQAIAEGIRNGMKRVVLDVRKSNVPAVSLYQSIGFTVTSIRKSFYSNGEDAYSMTLYLDDDAIKF
jgi:ribosomal-protein-alanine N-acetyltransferase